jgi:hypothetical protein
MVKLKNNLFTYAASELSQDAFLCWLLSFAQQDSKTCPVLRACAEAFLRVAIPGLGNSQICVNEISRQDHFIDVLITVNNRYKLIIEDKTNTNEHGSQLNDYKQVVGKNFPGFKACGVYYKTGFQSDYSVVQSAGYVIIDRRKMIEIMEPFADKITNNIWKDYYEFITEFEREAQRFHVLPIDRWGWLQINAFYDHLKHSGFLEKLDLTGNYGYVSNPGGGFNGMWFGRWDQLQVLDIRCQLYLQLQFMEGNLQICLKLGADQKDFKSKRITARMLRDHIAYGVKGEYLFSKYGFHRPARFGNGRTMTLGEYQKLPLYAEKACVSIKDVAAAYLKILRKIQKERSY